MLHRRLFCCATCGAVGHRQDSHCDAATDGVTLCAACYDLTRTAALLPFVDEVARVYQLLAVMHGIWELGLRRDLHKQTA